MVDGGVCIGGRESRGQNGTSFKGKDFLLHGYFGWIMDLVFKRSLRNRNRRSHMEFNIMNVLTYS